MMQIVKKIKWKTIKAKHGWYFAEWRGDFRELKHIKKPVATKSKSKWNVPKKRMKKKLRKKPIDGSSKTIVILLIKIYDVMKFLSKSQHFKSKPEHTKKIPSRRRRRSWREEKVEMEFHSKCDNKFKML